MSSSEHILRAELMFFVLPDTTRRFNYSTAIIHGLKSAATALDSTAFTGLGALVETLGKEVAVETRRLAVNGVAAGATYSGTEDVLVKTTGVTGTLDVTDITIL